MQHVNGCGQTFSCAVCAPEEMVELEHHSDTPVELARSGARGLQRRQRTRSSLRQSDRARRRRIVVWPRHAISAITSPPTRNEIRKRSRQRRLSESTSRMVGRRHARARRDARQATTRVQRGTHRSSSQLLPHRRLFVSSTTVITETMTVLQRGEVLSSARARARTPRRRTSARIGAR
jgi:hypothetical protein